MNAGLCCQCNLWTLRSDMMVMCISEMQNNQNENKFQFISERKLKHLPRRHPQRSYYCKILFSRFIFHLSFVIIARLSSLLCLLLFPVSSHQCSDSDTDCTVFLSDSTLCEQQDHKLYAHLNCRQTCGFCD